MNIVTRPKHSLLRQSQHAEEAKLAVNGDGFGLAWYGEGPEPGLYRDVLPAWADDNLASICKTVASGVFLAHVRASTTGETSRANCHPFKHGHVVFCHNGQIPHFADIRRRLENLLPDTLYQARRGTTDSEVLFLLLLANGLTDDPARAFTITLDQVGTMPDAPVKLTCCWSDGATLFAYRHASWGPAPTLYQSGPLDNGGQAFASEPLSDMGATWSEVPCNQVCRLHARPVGLAA